MYIWQWRTCAFKHPFPQMHCFPSLVGFTVARKTNALCPKAGWPLLSIENNTNVAFSWLIYDKKKVKRKRQSTQSLTMCEVKTWREIMYNIMSTILHHIQLEMPAQTTSREGLKRCHDKERREHWTWVRDPGCYGFSDNRSVAVITHSIAPIASV